LPTATSALIGHPRLTAANHVKPLLRKESEVRIIVSYRMATTLKHHQPPLLTTHIRQADHPPFRNLPFCPLPPSLPPFRFPSPNQSLRHSINCLSQDCGPLSVVHLVSDAFFIQLAFSHLHYCTVSCAQISRKRHHVAVDQSPPPLFLRPFSLVTMHPCFPTHIPQVVNTTTASRFGHSALLTPEEYQQIDWMYGYSSAQLSFLSTKNDTEQPFRVIISSWGIKPPNTPLIIH
jgi:hypothetical protein